MNSVFILTSGILIFKNSKNLDIKNKIVIGKRNIENIHSSKKNFTV